MSERLAPDADLRWRDPSGYEDLHRRVRTHVLGRIRGTEGRARRRAATDVIYLHRLNPVMAPLFDHIDDHRVPEAELPRGGRHHLVFAHDWRLVPWEDFITMMGHRELDDGPATAAPANPLRPTR